MNFMLPVPDASRPAVDVCSRKVSSNNNLLSVRYIVVRNEVNLKEILCFGIVVYSLAISLMYLMIAFALA